MNDFKKGLVAGIPIGLGYLSVSFTFGILAVSYGLYWWQAVVISMTTLTSAGQLAGVGIMIHPGQYIEMLISQITINLRYSFMSVSLSQKVSPEFKGAARFLLGFFMTDEIFAVASQQKSVSVKFFTGLATIPYFGWALGTLFGALLGNVLPSSVMNALCLAIYGMFIAIIAPDAKRSASLLLIIGVAVALSCAFYYLPLLNTLSSGLAISISAVAAAALGALLFPIKEEAENG
ncbi:MAG: AzlC family ABC transporter permease [Clostridia bacterium]|nr:AzlC family ABC transporter permease [Clostridia bacterium]MBR2327101.1 AzlC family ABC transporter permease [Clostridia bacterium]